MIFVKTNNNTIQFLNIINLYSYIALQCTIIILFLKDNKMDLLRNIFVIPVYLFYMMMPFYVTYIAIFEFFTDVSHWNKTEHCISKMLNKEN